MRIPKPKSLKDYLPLKPETRLVSVRISKEVVDEIEAILKDKKWNKTEIIESYFKWFIDEYGAETKKNKKSRTS